MSAPRPGVGGRLLGSLLGASIAVVGWAALGVTGFAPRLFVALVGFGLGHGIVAIVRGGSSARAEASAPSREPERSSNAALYVAAAAAVVIVMALAGTLWTKWKGSREQKEYDERLQKQLLAAHADASSSPDAGRATQIDCKSACEVTGPFDWIVVDRLARDGFDVEKQGIGWRDVRPEEIATLAAAPKGLRDLSIECAAGVSDLSALSAAASTLQTLSLDCPEADASTIPTIPGLKDLRMRDVPLRSLDFARGMTSLEWLDVSASADFRVSVEVQKMSGRLQPGDALWMAADQQPLEWIDLAPLSGLAKLKVLALSARAVGDLSPLSSLHALEHLGLNETPVADLSPLRSLGTLKVLDLGDAPAKDLSPLGDLSALTDLWLRGASAKKFEFLSRLRALQYLEITATDFDDLSVVKGLPDLRKLEVSPTKIADWSALPVLASRATIEELGVGGPHFSDLSLVRGMPKLRFLAIDDCTVKNPGALAALPALDHLFLSDVHGMRLMPLASAPKLEDVSALGVALDEADVAAFRKARPAVTIER